jgi:hypothetical protein
MAIRETHEREKSHLSHQYESIRRSGRTCACIGPSGEKTLEGDSVVMTVFETGGDFFKNTGEFSGEVFIIGDARKPRRLNNAIHDGYRLGMVL